jgi:hypothetical protein
MIPSLKELQRIKHMPSENASRVRKELQAVQHLSHEKKLEGLRACNGLVNGCGVEYQKKGNNKKSPEFWFINQGKTYDDTLVLVDGRFVVASLGYYAERGDYT